MRFETIQNKEFINTLLPFLKEKGYVQIDGRTGGDDDFICIDILNKEWCYCENGFSPFCSYDEMLRYQFKGEELKLSDLVKIRQ
jgi:hypothetical protein